MLFRTSWRNVGAPAPLLEHMVPTKIVIKAILQAGNIPGNHIGFGRVQIALDGLQRTAQRSGPYSFQAERPMESSISTPSEAIESACGRTESGA